MDSRSLVTSIALNISIDPAFLTLCSFLRREEGKYTEEAHIEDHRLMPFDERKLRETMFEALKQYGFEREVGISSRTPFGHIRQIDFKTKDRDEAVASGKRHNCGLVLETGNSFHAYGNTGISSHILFGKSHNGLISYENNEFKLWMMELKADPAVDEKWVDHSIRRGYSNLRVTNFSGAKLPEIIWDGKFLKSAPIPVDIPF